MNLDPLASYVKQREGQRVIRKILISNNGMAAVKVPFWGPRVCPLYFTTHRQRGHSQWSEDGFWLGMYLILHFSCNDPHV